MYVRTSPNSFKESLRQSDIILFVNYNTHSCCTLISHAVIPIILIFPCVKIWYLFDSFYTCIRRN